MNWIIIRGCLQQDQSMTELSPRLQGFPTILRADVPLRLMRSCIYTFARDLSAYLANIISSLIGNLDFLVLNSAIFLLP